MRISTLKVGAGESEGKEVGKVSLLDALADPELDERALAKPVEVGGQGARAEVESDANAENRFRKRGTEEEAAKLALEQDVHRLNDVVEWLVGSREGDDRLRREARSEREENVLVEQAQLADRWGRQEWRRLIHSQCLLCHSSDAVRNSIGAVRATLALPVTDQGKCRIPAFIFLFDAMDAVRTRTQRLGGVDERANF
jgi:hypothetical protein